VRRGRDLHDLGMIEDGSVLIRDGTVAAVGSTRRIENLKEARDALEIPANGRVVMPAFVDPSLNLSVKKTANSSPDSQKSKKLSQFYDESIALLRSCLLHGTLTAEIRADGGGSDFHSDIAVLRRLAKIGNNPIEVVRTWRINQIPQDDSFPEFCETLAKLLRRKWAQFIELPSEMDEVANERLLQTLEETSLGIKLRWLGGSPDILASLVSRMSPRAVACPTYLSSPECSVLSNSESIAVFAPAKRVFEAAPATCARRVADGGGAIALCTEYDFKHPASSSMQMALSSAVLRLKLTVEEAITASTINAAHAAGCAKTTGSLETTKQANALLLNVADYREIPRQFGINHVDMAIRNGNIVFSRTHWKMSAPNR